VDFYAEHFALGGFFGKAFRSWWIFRKKHFTFGGFLEKPLCSW